MNFTLDDLISEFLSFEKPILQPKKNITNRLLHRRDVDKQLQDEKEMSEAKILKDGELAETFLNSPYYKELVQPFIHTTIKSNFHKLLSEEQELTEVQIKSLLAVIKIMYRQVSLYKLKVIQAQVLKEGIK